MSETQNNRQFAMNRLEPRRIGTVNWLGLLTFSQKEISRFLSVYLQSILAPVITTLLFYAIFALAFGGLTQVVNGVPYLHFLAPGLVMMTMVQNAFTNTSSSIVISKIQGNIVDILMPPLSAEELLAGYLAGGIARGFIVGFASAVAISLFVPMTVYSLFYVVVFAMLGTTMLAALGIIAGIWSEKFDHIAAVSNFVITPLTFLSGTFYSMDRLPGAWQNAAYYNPFFHMIDGFRYGFIGQADASIGFGLLFLVCVDIFLILSALWMLKSGYKIKA